MRQRDELRQRCWQGRRHRCGERRSAADRAGGVEAEPGVDASEVERVATIRQHPQRLAFPVMVETDRAQRRLPFDFSASASASISGGSASKGESGVGVDDGLVEAWAREVVGIVDLRDEEYAGGDDAAGAGAEIRRVPVVEAVVAEEEVGEQGG
eukprot:TRINITY_DN1996_c0_g1_i3.p2 TRINITY_DN1996_c0_g1~~TRINITY_DN1996_c0_g1_i3.p2  ORF type:complete len:154 (+),score=29.75 TRINITY_DN1996_c0_g1_i3:442-903(+)